MMAILAITFRNVGANKLLKAHNPLFTNQVIHEIQVLMNTGLQVYTFSDIKYIWEAFVYVFCLLIDISGDSLLYHVKINSFCCHIQVLALFFSTYLGFGSYYRSASERTYVLGTLQLHRHLPHHRADEDNHLCGHRICKRLCHSSTPTCLGL